VATDSIISVSQAAAIRKFSDEGIIKAITSGRLECVKLSGKGYMLSERQVRGLSFNKKEFLALCSRYVSVPEACNIVWKTDAAVIRDIKSGRLSGFRLNPRCWAVLKRSAEDEFHEYLTARKQSAGRPRTVGGSRSPRDLRKKPLKKTTGKVQSQRGANR
jgi:hypothetical protein